MSLRIAIQMDPIEPVDITADSTFALALEAQRRGHTLFHYMVKDMSLRSRRVMAHGRPLQVRAVEGDHFEFGDWTELDLATDIDMILMRQDPPFDMAYITATHILEHIHPQTLVLNDPGSVRNAPEKLFVTHFPDLMPETLITANPADIRRFRDEHKDIILKPLFGNGGAGVFHLKPGDENLSALIEMFTKASPEPIIAQRYLAAVREGDKRIILIDGEPAGVINRVPAEGEARSNMHVGGTPIEWQMNDRDREICAAIGPSLREQGLIFVGIDVIGDLMTEINVTSPTGIQEISRFDGTDLAAQLLDAFEAKYAATR